VITAQKPGVADNLLLGRDSALRGGRRLGFTTSGLIHLLFLLVLVESYRISPPPRQTIFESAKVFAPPRLEMQKETLRTPPPLAAPTQTPQSAAEAETPPPRNPFSPDDVQLDRESLELVDPAGEVEEVLGAHGGSVAFSLPDAEGHLEHIFKAPGWIPISISGYIPSDRYCSFTMIPPWAIAIRIAGEHGLPRNSIAYVVFERSMCNNLWRMIREFAGRNGIGCVKHTRLRFDSGNETLGFSVLDIKECDGGPGPKQ
jgi:hypothetical protein